jgi:hypothetical protein
MIPALLERLFGDSYRTTLFGIGGCSSVVAAVIAPKWGIQVDFLYVAIFIVSLGQVFGADAASILNVRKFLDEAKK